MKQKLVALAIVLFVVLSCNNADPKAEKERAYFYQETLLGFDYILNTHYNRYQETYGAFYSGSPNDQQKQLKNVFDANFELKEVVDYRLVEEGRTEDEKRRLLFDELSVFVKNNLANVPDYYRSDFQNYIKNMQFSEQGFEHIQVLDSTDRHMFMTKANMITIRAVQMNY